MCGRYSDSGREPRYPKALRIITLGLAVSPRFNICPSQNARVVAADQSGAFSMNLMRWGLVPPWAKDQSIAYKMINARAETLAEKPSYRTPFKRQRCLVVADGFYEWKKSGKTKVPHYFTLRDNEAFACAGLWECYQAPDKPDLLTFTIITTTPNRLVGDIHDRMPVILPPEYFEAWLDPLNSDVQALARLLVPFPSENMKVHPVSTLVNNPRFDDSKCIEPVTA